MGARLLRRAAIADAYQTAAGISLVQQASGSTGVSAPSTYDAAFGAASTTGNKLLLATVSDATVSTPSGWTLVKSEVDVNGLYLWSKTSAGETTVTLTPSVAAASSWWIAEYTGLDISAALKTASAHTSSGSPNTQTTGTTASTSGATNGLAVACWGSSRFGSPTVNTTSMTNSYAEQADVTADASSKIQLAVGTLTPSGDGTFESTETLSTTAFSIGGVIAVFAHT